MTKAVNEAVMQRIEECRDQLEHSGDEKFSLVVQGMVRAYRDILELEPVLLVEDIENAV